MLAYAICIGIDPRIHQFMANKKYRQIFSMQTSVKHIRTFGIFTLIWMDSMARIYIADERRTPTHMERTHSLIIRTAFSRICGKKTLTRMIRNMRKMEIVCCWSIRSRRKKKKKSTANVILWKHLRLTSRSCSCHRIQYHSSVSASFNGIYSTTLSSNTEMQVRRNYDASNI